VWCTVLTAPAQAAPRLPTRDDEVLAQLPQPAPNSPVRALRAQRAALQADPRNPTLALAVARSCFAATQAEGDPRYIGQAEAALAPWWDQPEPPPDIRVMRAVLRQFDHQFAAARSDLEAVVAQQPAMGEAWSWLAAIAMVQARYDDARTACGHMAPLASPVIGVACRAAAEALTGQAPQAAQALQQTLASDRAAGADERLWALTRLGEIQARIGQAAGAEASYREALGLGQADVYLLAAYADFLLDQGRPAEVLRLLAGQERSDLLLLRLAIAAKATGDAQAATWRDALSARFDAAGQRGDQSHQKEASRFQLAVLGNATAALADAVANYQVQKEPADARALLEAALAAGQPAAAEPALRWLRDNQVQAQRLQALAAQLGRGQ
jgi:predicted Zn-dependent protease